jgi:hypothetical protein
MTLAWTDTTESSVGITHGGGGIGPVPRYFGGDADNRGESKWDTAYAALQQYAKGDKVLQLIADRLDDAWADSVEEAADYGRSVGLEGGGELCLDSLSDRQFEARTGRPRARQ